MTTRMATVLLFVLASELTHGGFMSESGNRGHASVRSTHPCERNGESCDNPYFSRSDSTKEMHHADPTISGATRFIDGYSDHVYAKMRDDVVRTEAYRRALQNVVRDKTIVDIGTGALALLAIFAAEAGARKVYAIEANVEAYAKALQAYPCSLFAGFS